MGYTKSKEHTPPHVDNQSLGGDINDKLTQYVKTALYRGGAKVLYHERHSQVDFLLHLKPLLFKSDFLEAYVEAFYEKMKHLPPFQIVGLESTSFPLMAALVTFFKQKGVTLNACGIRKSRKKDGLLSRIEGALTQEPVVIIDDVVNSGSSLQMVIKVLDAFFAERDDRPDVCAIVSIIFYHDLGRYHFGQNIQLIPLVDRREVLDEALLTSLQKSAKAPDYYSSKKRVFSWSPPHPSTRVPVERSHALFLCEEFIIVLTEGGCVYALHKESGKELWSYQIPQESLVYKAFQYATIADSTLLFLTRGGVMFALDIPSGKKLWHSVQFECLASTLSVSNGVVLFFDEVGLAKKSYEFTRVSLREGKVMEKVRYVLSGGPISLLETAHSYLVSTRVGDLISFSKNTHKEEKSIHLCQNEREEVTSFAQFSPPDQGYSAIIKDSNEETRVCLYDSTLSLTALCPGIIYDVKGDIYVDDRVIITGSLDGVVRSFDKVTGKCLWECQLRGRIYATPRVSIIRGVVVVLVGTTRGILYELDYHTGVPLHEILVSERILNDPLVDGESGRLYLITEGSHVYVLDDVTQ